jgi:GT2 family glycosyltransferase
MIDPYDWIIAWLGGDVLGIRTSLRRWLAATPRVGGFIPATDHLDGTRPRVSIVIPLFNQLDYTQRCLAALDANTPPSLYELVLVDNASTDGTARLLERPPAGATVLRNSRNLGFARACNQGAAVTRAPCIVFLNNDTEPLPDWLPSLVEPLQRQADVAAVGAKLLFPDGRIQHAGVLIAENRQTSNPLRPFHRLAREPGGTPEANRREDLQAVTAAVLAVRRSAFAAVGGFDEGYWNGYEDIDLCLAFREAGWRVVYEPKSCLIHHESMSGPERFKGASNNMARLHARWLGKVVPDVLVTEDGAAVPHPRAAQPSLRS